MLEDYPYVNREDRDKICKSVSDVLYVEIIKDDHLVTDRSWNESSQEGPNFLGLTYTSA